jgi:aryl-alcohol dehydrogenase-like predicted oxidoreductase
MSISTTELAPAYRASRLIKGCWHLAGGHGEVNQAQAIQDMAAFVEAGLTTFDCADHYIGVEALIGQFRRAYPELATQLQVHTKCVPDYDRLTSCDRAYLTGIIDRSLERLGVAQLDLVQFHWWNLAQPGYVEALGILSDLRREGKIAHLGLTNFNTALTREILDAGIPLVSTQVQYSLLDSRPDQGLIALCQERGVQLLCYGTLAGGLLSDAWLGQAEPTEPLANRSHTKYKLIIEDFGGWDLFQELLHALQAIATRHGVGLGDVATRWVIDRPQVASAIMGFTSTRYLPATQGIEALRLDAQDHALLAPLLGRRTGPAGDCYDIERDKEGRHGRIMRYNQNEGRH